MVAVLGIDWMIISLLVGMAVGLGVNLLRREERPLLVKEKPEELALSEERRMVLKPIPPLIDDMKNAMPKAGVDEITVIKGDAVIANINSDPNKDAELISHEEKYLSSMDISGVYSILIYDEKGIKSVLKSGDYYYVVRSKRRITDTTFKYIHGVVTEVLSRPELQKTVREILARPEVIKLTEKVVELSKRFEIDEITVASSEGFPIASTAADATEEAAMSVYTLQSIAKTSPGITSVIITDEKGKKAIFYDGKYYYTARSKKEIDVETLKEFGKMIDKIIPGPIEEKKAA